MDEKTLRYFEEKLEEGKQCKRRIMETENALRLITEYEEQTRQKQEGTMANISPLRIVVARGHSATNQDFIISEPELIEEFKKFLESRLAMSNNLFAAL